LIVFFLVFNYLAAFKERYKEDDQGNRFTEFVKTSLMLEKNNICKKQGRATANKPRASSSTMGDQQDQQKAILNRK
jgi:hypothetical protein